MSLLRNGAFNLAGALLPALALFVTIPLIVHRLGADAYGALVLVTSIVGYFGIIDVNATAGTVKFVAEHQARGDDAALAQVVVLGGLIHLALGLAGAAGLYVGAPALVQQVFQVDQRWQAEAESALRWSAAAFLVSQLQAWLQGLPQGLQRYDVVGRYEALFGSLVPLATLAVVAAGGALVAIVVARLVLALLHLVLLARATRALLPGVRLQRPRRAVLRGLLSFSVYSWLQRLAALTTQNADKLLLGAQQSLSALAAYAVPMALGSRVFGLLYRLLQAAFPLASALAAQGQVHQLRERCVRLQRVTLYLNICLWLLCVLFARELLHHWLQGRAPEQAATVLVLVASMLLADALTHVPSLVNDGLGRPRITATAALLRAALGVAAAWLALRQGGVVALALSQLLVSLAVALGFVWWVHRRSLPWTLAQVARRVYGLNSALLAIGLLLMAWRWRSPPLPPAGFAAALLCTLVLLAALGWWRVLAAGDRQRLRRIARRWMAGAA